ncbi:MAG: prenyltransferase [Myxococcota bacterium]|nr:prenyltransferase [Myxococcota bacterium]
MTKHDNLDQNSALALRLFAWANERFPASNAVLFVVLYGAALLYGRSLNTDGPLSMSGFDLLGFAAVWSFFLMLRIFDEHKDYDLDCVNHPDRVLQSGLIRLSHLKVLCGLAICIQAAYGLIADGGLGPITFAWIAVMAWSSLMAVEFFCGAWLEKRLVLYALSHMLVMPIALLWMVQMGAGHAPLNPDVGWLAGLSFLSGAAFEITRKLKAPEDERPTVDSYTKVMGLSLAPLVVLCLLGGETAFLMILACLVFGGILSSGWYLALAAPMLPAIWALLRFRRAPSASRAKMSEGAVALTMLSGYVLLSAALVIHRGLEWG